MIGVILGVGATSLVAFSFHYIYRFLFEKPSLKDYTYPYKEPGTVWRIKFLRYWVHELLFRKYSKRFNVINVKSKNIYETGALPNKFQHGLENPQHISSPTTMDETGFMGVNLTTGNILNVYMAKRQNNQCEAVIHFVVNDKGQRKEFQLPLLPRTLRRNKQDGEGNCWTCNDLKIWCLSPMSRWRISFNGLLREINSDEITYVTFNFVWVLFSRVIDHQDDTSAASRAWALTLSEANDPKKDLEWILNQYDTWGTFYGTYTIDDSEEIEILLFGSKIRRIGEFHASDIHKFMQIKGYVEDGTTFSFNAINVPKRVPEMIWGYVELGNGTRELVKSSDFELLRFKDEDLPPDLLSVGFNTSNDKYILTITTDNGGKFSHIWGQSEEMKVNCQNMKVCLTSLKHGIRLNGYGMMSVSSKNDLELGPSKKLPPLLTEPDIEVTSSTPNILQFSDESCKSSKLVGGKGSSLAILKQIKSDFEVPNGLCITVVANNKHIEDNKILKNNVKKISDICCGKTKQNIEEECISLGKIFEKTELSKTLKEELKQNLLSLFGENFAEIRFAVRSSAIGEDGEEMSAAGQMETILGCKGLEQIFDGIKKCWASCYGFRAVEYRRQNGQQIEVGMSVVVQQMVAAEKAGVLFTRDPVNGNPSVISIAANYGIGESVVSAMSEPDTIVVNRTFDDQFSIGDINIGKKELQVTMKDDGGVEQKNISEEETKCCCLTNEEVLKLAELGVLVEQSYGNPRDMEWAIYEDKIFLLQARPITNLHNETEYFLRNELNLAMLTDSECANSGNFKEVFPGATSTLNNDFFNRLFNLFGQQMGVEFGRSAPPNTLTMKGSIIVQQHRFSDRGQIFYSEIQKYPSQRTLNFQLGLDIAFNGRKMEDEELRRKCLIRSRYCNNVMKFKQMLFGIKAVILSKRLLKKMKQKFSSYELKINFSKSNEEIIKEIITSHDSYLQAMSDHVIITMASLFMNTTVLLFLLGSETEFNDIHYGDFALLLSIDSGSEAVESADVPSAMQALAKEIAAKCDCDKFLKMSKEEGKTFLTSDECPVKESYQDFIIKHGHRCLKEFDVQSTTWRMDPSKLIVPLQALVRAKDMAKDKKLTIDEALERLQTKWTSKQKKELKTNVLRAREYVGYREQAKSLLIRTVDQYRQQFRKFGRKLVDEGRLTDEELIFFMTTEELLSLMKTRSAKIIQRAMKRKKLHPTMDKLKFPEVCYGPPKPIDEKIEIIDSLDGKLGIKGTPVSRGIVEGTARVVPFVEDAHHIQPGDILITNATDIAWSPYFPSLSGVVTEIGGLISHGAVVAREYGIPCVVGVKNATMLLKSGDKIRLNGCDGKIQILSKD